MIFRNKFDYDLIIIGQGSGGLTASIGGSIIGAKVLAVEKEKIGGDCTHYGCVPSKTLIKAGQVAKKFKEFKKYGLEIENKKIYKNIKFDIDKVLKKVQSTIKEVYNHERPEILKKKFGINFVFGEAKFFDKNTIIVNNKKYTSKKIVIATGSRALVPNDKDIDKNIIMTNKDIFHPKKYKSITVVGGGVIGCEISEALNNLGIKVNLIHTRSHLLNKIGEDEISDTITKNFIKEGINVFLNKRVVKVKKDKNQKVTYFKDSISNKISNIKSDEVLFCVGRVPNLDNLDLKKIGIKYKKNGILINDKCQTNIKNIYAIGDVCGGNQYTHFANHQGKIVLANSIFGNFFKFEKKVIPKVVFIESDIAQVGLNKKELIHKNIDFYEFRKEYKNIDKAITQSNDFGFFKIYTDKKGFILGASFFGENSGELISEIALAMKNKINIKSISNTIHPYPTYSYGLRNLCDDFRGKGFTKKKKNLIQKIFGLRGKR